MSKWLEGRIAVVTVAARGIGRANAELLAHEGTRRQFTLPCGAHSGQW